MIVDLEMASRLVTLMRKRALIDQRDPEHRHAAGYFHKQAKQLGRAVARARRRPAKAQVTVGDEHE